MKKISFYLAMTLSFIFTSCTNELNVTDSQESNVKTEETRALLANSRDLELNVPYSSPEIVLLPEMVNEWTTVGTATIDFRPVNTSAVSKYQLVIVSGGHAGTKPWQIIMYTIYKQGKEDFHRFYWSTYGWFYNSFQFPEDVTCTYAYGVDQYLPYMFINE